MPQRPNPQKPFEEAALQSFKKSPSPASSMSESRLSIKHSKLNKSLKAESDISETAQFLVAKCSSGHREGSA